MQQQLALVEISVLLFYKGGVKMSSMSRTIRRRIERKRRIKHHGKPLKSRVKVNYIKKEEFKNVTDLSFMGRIKLKFKNFIEKVSKWVGRL